MRRPHLVAYAVFSLVLLGGVYRVETIASSTRDALCDFKHDVERRRDLSAEFRDQIRDGDRPPIPGVSIADLDRSVENLQSTLDALSDLDCD